METSGQIDGHVLDIDAGDAYLLHTIDMQVERIATGFSGGAGIEEQFPCIKQGRKT